MIHPHEIRIGNIIGFYKSKLSEMQVGVIREIALQEEGSNLYHVTIKEFGQVPISVTGIAPIQLNESWFLNFGFEWGKMPFSGLDGLHISGDDGLKSWFVGFSKRGDAWQFANPHFNIWIDKVHELQNLCFSLTQKELQLNPNA